MKMRKTGWVIVSLLALIVLVTTNVMAKSDFISPDVPAAGTINYQGRLTNPNGKPLDGVFPMRFRIYNSAISGTLLWDSSVMNISVDNGLFNVELDVYPEIFNGQGLWLRIYVDGEWLSPRQELLPVPYALSLIPGAEISGSFETGGVLNVKNNANSSNGSAVWGESVRGTGVLGASDNDIGVYGATGGTTSSDYGVFGIGEGISYGVHGYNSGTTGGLGIFGKNAGGGSGTSGYNEGFGNGTWGYSVEYNGVGGGTGRADGNYGLYTSANLYSANFHTSGAMMQVAQNGDTDALERGDVVVISGLGKSPAEGQPPIIQVRKVREAGSTAILGVVAASYAREWFTAQPLDATGGSIHNQEIPLSDTNPVTPGDFLLVVIQGPCYVKATIDEDGIQAGDLLSSAQVPGYASKAPQLTVDEVKITASGIILGKALETLDEYQGLIYAFVTLR